MSSIREEAKSLNIHHFKMSTGDEIVALLSKKKDHNYVIEAPLVLVSVTTGDSYSYHFKEWFPLSDTDFIVLNKFHIVSHVEVDLNTKEQYLQTIINIATANYDEPDEYDISLPKDTVFH